MARKNRQRLAKLSRESKVTVRVSRNRVVERLFMGAFGLVAGTFLAGYMMLSGHIWAGLFFLIVIGILPLAFAVMWKSEIGKVDLTLNKDGITYEDRVVRWVEIASVQLVRKY